MKKLIFILFMFVSPFIKSQTVAEKSEFIKFMNYCQSPIEVDLHIRGVVNLLNYNSDYSKSILYYSQPITGDWISKYPLSIKWYQFGTTSITTEINQTEITAVAKIKVQRVYCSSKTEYLALFRAHWKNGDMQSGWWDSHYLPMSVKF